MLLLVIKKMLHRSGKKFKEIEYGKDFTNSSEIYKRFQSCLLMNKDSMKQPPPPFSISLI